MPTFTRIINGPVGHTVTLLLLVVTTSPYVFGKPPRWLAWCIHCTISLILLANLYAYFERNHL
jgi:hypothetical protein